MKMLNKYYVYYPEQDYIEGPMSFKKACKVREDSLYINAQILMLVVDENGREVK